MRVLNKKGTFAMSIFLIGTMTMSGCGASGDQVEDQTIQEESTAVILESIREEIQTTTETVTIEETQTTVEEETETTSMLWKGLYHQEILS